ncbi:MAG: oxidoreductase [Proteobacteria bacterium]|nr:oxidoreductase [Pseudomonadota bacterium]
MADLETIDKDFYKGLQALSDSSFPKKCSTCGKIYDNVHDYLALTKAIGRSSGLKESLDDDDKPLVELFRNCVCGSTLMDVFNNRRDLSPAGLKRRQKFEELLNRLTNNGFAAQTARDELLKIMRGEGSDLLKVKPSEK